MSGIAAYKAKVTLGATKVLGIGTWKMAGVEVDELDDSEFDDTWKTFSFGMKDGGAISIEGWYKKDDSTGQDVLRLANLNNSAVTSLRLYIDGTSYYEPCRTTGYFTPASTTGQLTKLSEIHVTGYEVGAEKAGLVSFSATMKVSGCMVLV